MKCLCRLVPVSVLYVLVPLQIFLNPERIPFIHPIHIPVIFSIVLIWTFAILSWSQGRRQEPTPPLF